MASRRYDITVIVRGEGRVVVSTRATSPAKARAQVQYRLISEGRYPVEFVKWEEYPF